MTNLLKTNPKKDKRTEKSTLKIGYFLNEVWKVLDGRTFKSIEVVQFAAKFQISRAVFTSMVDCQMAKPMNTLHTKGLYTLVGPNKKENVEKLMIKMRENNRISNSKNKKNVKTNIIPTRFKDRPKNDNLNEIDAAVKLLKSKGYKIYQPVTEFKEI